MEVGLGLRMIGDYLKYGVLVVMRCIFLMVSQFSSALAQLLPTGCKIPGLWFQAKA